MILFRWQKGRQESAQYYKFPLWYFKILKLGFDAYILKFPAKTIIKSHTDIVPNGKHYRLNILLKGSNLFMKEKQLFYKKRFVFFRPDIEVHKMQTKKGCIILSFGFVKYDK